MKPARTRDLEQYAYQAHNPWRWRPAAGTDCQDMTDMALVDYGPETDTIFRNSVPEYQRNIMLATVNQFYNPKTELISVARAVGTDSLLAYTWARRGEHSPWSAEEQIVVRIAHVDQGLTDRQRVTLCAQMIRMWETWAEACDVRIICSSTVRADQEAFLRLHEQAGYVRRGSICYKRLAVKNFEIDEPRIILTGI